MADFEDGLTYFDFGSRLLRLGVPQVIGTDVKLLQHLINKSPLAAAPDRPLLEDGVFGPKTAAAVERLQSYFNLTVDGIAGPETFFCLGEATDDFLVLGPKFGSRVLGLGMEGGDAAILQNRLNCCQRKFALVIGQPATGVFDDRTAEAVRILQNKARAFGFNLHVDGRVGPETYNFMRMFHSAGGRVLQRGRRGIDVFGLQNVLAAQGYYRGVFDGFYGSNTEMAVRDFQREHRLKTDGIAGRELYWALGQATN